MHGQGAGNYGSCNGNTEKPLRDECEVFIY